MLLVSFACAANCLFNVGKGLIIRTQQHIKNEQRTKRAGILRTSAGGVVIPFIKYSLFVCLYSTMYDITLVHRIFGWTPANEINNGRWVMMGFAIGLLTEYATGVDFPHQLQLMLSYLGIVDLD